MAKGDIVKNTFREYRDKYTGRLVTQLTSAERLSHHPYFYNKMITNDSKYLIYASSYDTSSCDNIRNLYKMDLSTGDALQLTEGPHVGAFSANLSSDDTFLVYKRSNAIYKLDLRTLNEEIIYETPVEWFMLSVPSLGSDDKYLVLVEMKESDRVKPAGGWSAFVPQFEARPHCRIIMIDINKRASWVVHENEHCQLGHAQIRPNDNNTVMFCHEGPWDRVDARIWLVNSDGTNLRCARPREGNEQVGHEFWLSDGSKLAFVHFKKDYGVDATIRLIDPITLEEEILMECHGYSHFISNHDNSMIVADGHHPEEAFIYLVNLELKTEEKLCWHGTSWKCYKTTQDSHPHPAFSPDGSFVIFTSDKDGLPAIYKVEL